MKLYTLEIGDGGISSDSMLIQGESYRLLAPTVSYATGQKRRGAVQAVLHGKVVATIDLPLSFSRAKFEALDLSGLTRWMKA